MIRINQINNKRFEVSYETGAEYKLLKAFSIIINDRNNLKMRQDNE